MDTQRRSGTDAQPTTRPHFVDSMPAAAAAAEGQGATARSDGQTDGQTSAWISVGQT